MSLMKATKYEKFVMAMEKAAPGRICQYLAKDWDLWKIENLMYSVDSNWIFFSYSFVFRK